MDESYLICHWGNASRDLEPASKSIGKSDDKITIIVLSKFCR